MLGRFYQPDPVTFLEAGLGQINRYQYGRSDTYSYIDSDGKIVWFPIIAWAVLGGTVGGVFDASIQYGFNGKVNWKQTALATGFGAVGGPLGAQVTGWRGAASLGFALGGRIILPLR